MLPFAGRWLPLAPSAYYALSKAKDADFYKLSKTAF